jgi:hypothetical protein
MHLLRQLSNPENELNHLSDHAGPPGPLNEQILAERVERLVAAIPSGRGRRRPVAAT